MTTAGLTPAAALKLHIFPIVNPKAVNGGDAVNGGKAVNGVTHDAVNQMALDAMNVVAPAAGMVVDIIVATSNDNYVPIVVGAAHAPPIPMP
ncbi:hypothetical protein M0R45_005793 [Rubus argutus]|uniref:Uncharacterized protein n=1 Tax=Rubus argutus TaxID=59490 RepID=A0AAW1YNN6_RUBAR